MSAILSPWSGAPFLTSVSRTRTKYCPSETTKSTHEGSSLGWPEATSPDGRPNTIQVAGKTAYFLHDQKTRRQLRIRRVQDLQAGGHHDPLFRDCLGRGGERVLRSAPCGARWCSFDPP